jgi:hypothetical protein
MPNSLAGNVSRSPASAAVQAAEAPEQQQHSSSFLAGRPAPSSEHAMAAFQGSHVHRGHTNVFDRLQTPPQPPSFHKSVRTQPAGSGNAFAPPVHNSNAFHMAGNGFSGSEIRAMGSAPLQQGAFSVADTSHGILGRLSTSQHNAFGGSTIPPLQSMVGKHTIHNAEMQNGLDVPGINHKSHKLAANAFGGFSALAAPAKPRSNAFGGSVSTHMEYSNSHKAQDGGMVSLSTNQGFGKHAGFDPGLAWQQARLVSSVTGHATQQPIGGNAFQGSKGNAFQPARGSTALHVQGNGQVVGSLPTSNAFRGTSELHVCFICYLPMVPATSLACMYTYTRLIEPAAWLAVCLAEVHLAWCL